MNIRLQSEEVLEEFQKAGLLDETEGGGYLFKWKIGALQRLYGQYLRVPLRPRWKLDVNDDRPNDWREGDPFEPWRGKSQDDDRSPPRRDDYDDDEGPRW